MHHKIELVCKFFMCQSAKDEWGNCLLRLKYAAPDGQCLIDMFDFFTICLL
jgi:hypothetical protein